MHQLAMESEQLVLRVGEFYIWLSKSCTVRCPLHLHCLLAEVSCQARPKRKGLVPVGDLLVVWGFAQMPLLSHSSSLNSSEVDGLSLAGKQIGLSGKSIAAMLKNLLLRLNPGVVHKKPTQRLKSRLLKV